MTKRLGPLVLASLAIALAQFRGSWTAKYGHLAPQDTCEQDGRSMGAIIKTYLKSLLALAAAAAATAAVMWVVIAILTFDLGAFLSGLN